MTDAAWRASTGPDHRERALRRRALRRAPRARRRGRARLRRRRIRRRPTGGGRGAARPIVGPEARVSPFVRRLEELAGREVITTPSGQDRARLRTEPRRAGCASASTGPAGTEIALRHAEVLEHGELGTRPLRQAAATDRYTLAGDGERGVGARVHVPRLPLRRDRRAGPGEFDPADVTAVVHPQRHGAHRLVRDLRTRSSNQLHENVVWGMRGNFLYVPTDCPQRDERLGWTGDIQVFAPTASFLYDCAASSPRGCATSRSSSERDGGIVPFVVPNVARHRRARPPRGATPRPSCRGCCTSATATSAMLERQYPSMRAWVDVLLDDRRASGACGRAGSSSATGSTRTPRRTSPRDAKTDADIVATAYLFRSADDRRPRRARCSARRGDAARYARIAEEVRDAFLARVRHARRAG